MSNKILRIKDEKGGEAKTFILDDLVVVVDEPTVRRFKNFLINTNQDVLKRLINKHLYPEEEL